MISLEIAQAGLSWRTILKMRDEYRTAFSNFDFRLISNYDSEKIESLYANSGIVRNKLKILSVINNAKLALEAIAKYGSLDQLFWQFAPEKKPKPGLTKSSESIEMAKKLKQLGWRFIGPTICYSFMQASGMVNAHSERCIFSIED